MSIGGMTIGSMSIGRMSISIAVVIAIAISMAVGLAVGSSVNSSHVVRICLFVEFFCKSGGSSTYGLGDGFSRGVGLDV